MGIDFRHDGLGSLIDPGQHRFDGIGWHDQSSLDYFQPLRAWSV
jgi:hypothetical protein